MKIRLTDAYEYDTSGVKEEAIGQFISVTTQMKSFELYVFAGEASLVWLTYLQDSFKTLKEFRIIDVWPSVHNNQGLDYSLLKNLTRISLNEEGLKILFDDKNFGLPESLQVIEIPFYSFRDKLVEEKPEIKEEFHLASVLESHSLPNLREVNVPLGPVEFKMIETKSEQRRNSWRANRRILESVELFKKGKVLLTTSKPGEKGESQSLLLLIWLIRQEREFALLVNGKKTHRDQFLKQSWAKLESSHIELPSSLTLSTSLFSCFFFSISFTVGENAGISSFKRLYAFQT